MTAQHLPLDTITGIMPDTAHVGVWRVVSGFARYLCRVGRLRWPRRTSLVGTSYSSLLDRYLF